MGREVKTTPMQRLSYVEDLAGELERQARLQDREGRRTNDLTTRFARTQGNDPEDPNDPDYPEQIDGEGCRLPIVFLDVIYDEDADDPVTFVTRSSKPQAWLYSPYGWIPRLIDLEVRRQNGIWVVSLTSVPQIDAFVSVGGGILAGSTGEVTIVGEGGADDQTMQASLDFMHGDTGAPEDTEVSIRLLKAKRWGIRNRGC